MRKNKALKISIIILNWNQPDVTIDCLNSLSKIDSPKFKVFLIDNGSTKSNLLKLKKNLTYSFVKFIQLNENLGYAGGNNKGIGLALKEGYKYILLLNNDVFVEKNFLRKLLEIVEEDKTVGIVGPKINYSSKKSLIWSAGGKIDTFLGNHRLIFNKKKDVFNTKKLLDVGYVSGCALLSRSEIFEKIGLLDENYFLYGEESDFCYRVKKETGVKLVIRLDSKIYHKVSVSSVDKQRIVYYLTRNRLYFLSKYYSGFKLLIRFFFLGLLEFPKYLIYYPILYKDINVLRFFFKGIKDYFNKSFGRGLT